MKSFSQQFSNPVWPDKPRSLNCRGQLLSLEKPLVMGILNVTPDSFSDGGQFFAPAQALEHAGQMLEEGADLIDIGGYSSRPGAKDISPQEELDRIAPVVEQILKAFPEAILSIDTFRSSVALPMLEAGAHLINDISAGLADPDMLSTVARFDAPYILMHMQGTPQTMQKNPRYADVFEEIWTHLVDRVAAARAVDIKDLIIDPGFGFGKTLKNNYKIFSNIEDFNLLGLPILIGISRKSMIYRLFDTQPNDVKELTAALHMKALDAGANILRVHDVQPTRRVVDLWNHLKTQQKF